MIEVTKDPIHPELLADSVRKDVYGAVVIFVGMVRGYAEGKRVLFIEHQASKEEAEGKLQAIAREIRSRWGLDDVAISHRIGPLEVGEITLAIAVAAPHRQEAFEACQYAVDRFKQLVSLKEVTA